MVVPDTLRFRQRGYIPRWALLLVFLAGSVSLQAATTAEVFEASFATTLVTLVVLTVMVLMWIWSRQTQYRLQRRLKEIEEAEHQLRERQEMLDRTQMISSVMVAHVGLDGRWIKVPPRLSAVLNVPEEQLLRCEVGHPCSALGLVADRAQNARLQIDELKSYDLEVRRVGPDGRVIWLESSCVLARDSGGRPVHFVSYIRDISTRKQFEQDLQVARQFSDNLIDSSLDMIIAVNDQRCIVEFNRAAQESFGYREDEVVGHHIRMLYADESVGATIHKAIVESGRFVGHVRNIRKNGEIFHACLSAAALRDHEGKLTGVVGMSRDIAEQLRAEEELRAKTELLEQTTLALTEYLERREWRSAVARLLRAGLKLTGSTYGCAGVVMPGPSMNIVVQEELRSNGSWSGMRARPDDLDGFDLPNLDNLFGAAIVEARPIIANDGSADPRAGRNLQRGYPSFQRFLGVPIFSGSAIMGVIAVADREGRYESSHVVQLQNLASVIGLLYESHQQAERESNLQGQLRQAQKMEAVGQLAGGIAHDFNNLLLAIIGYNDLLAEQVGSSVTAREYLDEVRKAASRAAMLTRQLLAYSRRQLLQPRVIDLNDVVIELMRMLRRLIGENIELASNTDRRPVWVRADRGQLEQVIINLAVNARDAMPHGGRLTIESVHRHMTGDLKGVADGLKAGNYAVLTITDNGSGMNDEVKAHLFEPFYTTKEVGKGTGLGLSTVYGIVKQSGGEIQVESRLGRGSVFRIFLPQLSNAEALEKKALSPSTTTLRRRGRETVLLVEDEESVRILVHRVLQSNGYQVYEACDGREALRVLRTIPDPPQLLVTDLVMPEMGGKELAERLLGTYPGLRVLYISGYSEDHAVRDGRLHDNEEFLAKPFTPDEFLHRVRALFDRRVAS